MSPFNWNRRKMSFTLSKNEKEQFENPENDSTNISAKSSSNTVAICAVRSALFGFVLVLYIQLKMSLQNKKIKKTQEKCTKPTKKDFCYLTDPEMSYVLIKCALTFSLQLSMVCCFFTSAMKFYYSHGAATAAY